MPPPPRPANEIARLASLRSSGLVEGGRDPELNAIVHEAAGIFGTPIAAVSLLDGARQHFKAGVGLGVPYTTRDEAFCGYALLGTGALVVPDACADPRFSDNPLVLSAPGIRFYAGAPVFGADGLAFGALCVIGLEPRPVVDPAHVAALLALADRVSGLLARRLSSVVL